MSSPADQLIIALDHPDAEAARSLVERLGSDASTYKVGLELFVAEGPAFVEELVSYGKRIFLDLKFHDIPNTVAGAVRSAVKVGAWMVNVHAAGGAEMMRRAAGAARDAASACNRPTPLVIGVTMLTSADAGQLAELGDNGSIEDRVLKMAHLAAEAGLDGVVCSGHEAARVRQEIGDAFMIVTPGVRTKNATFDDQKRVMTPGESITAGANFLVVGRPISRAADPAEAFREIVDEIGGTV